MVPQALAYALLAGMPPINGLYTAFWPVLIYAFMGHSRQLSVGPDALVSTLFGAAVEIAPEHPLILAQCLGLLVGLMLLLLGLLRLGFLDVILSRPLLAGFVNAVAVEIIMEQSPALFGVATPKGVHGWHKIGYLIEHSSSVSNITALFGFASIAALLLSRVIKTVLKKRWPNAVLFPELLLVAGLNIGLSWGLGLSTEGLLTLGKMGSGFSEPTLPQFEKVDIDVSELFRVVLVITMIGFVESIVAAKIFADKHNYSVSANRELVAYGLSNVFGSFFGAWPTFGSLPRTVVADMAGATSLVFSAVTLLVVLGTILFLGPVFEHMPRVCGSAIIVVAAIGLVEIHDVVFLWKMRSYSSLMLFMFTFFLTVFAGVEVGVILSFIVSLFLVLKRVSKPHVDALGRVAAASPDQPAKYKGLVDNVNARPIKGVAIIRISDPLFFANTGALKSVLRRIEKYGSTNAHPSAKPLDKKLLGIVLHFGGVPSCDPSALYTLHEIAVDLKKRNVQIVFVKLNDHLKKRFRQAGITEPAKPAVFADVHTAVQHVLAHRAGSRVHADAETITAADMKAVALEEGTNLSSSSSSDSSDSDSSDSSSSSDPDSHPSTASTSTAAASSSTLTQRSTAAARETAAAAATGIASVEMVHLMPQQFSSAPVAAAHSTAVEAPGTPVPAAPAHVTSSGSSLETSTAADHAVNKSLDDLDSE
jgi:high affinity sulfate transporter 1